MEEEEALAEFQFLSGDQTDEPSASGRKGAQAQEGPSLAGGSSDQWGVDYQALSRMKEQYK